MSENIQLPRSYYQPLFDLLHQEHGLTLVESEMADIIHVVERMQGKQQGAVWRKDSYDRLYDQVKGGKRTVCWVNYYWDRDRAKEPLRDICTLSNAMEFVARGIGYGGAGALLKGEDEKTFFLKECERLNVEWLDESGTSAAGSEKPILTQSRADFIREANDRDMDGREQARASVFVPCVEDDPDCCGGYTSNDGRSLCHVKEINLPLLAFKQQKDNP